ARSPATTGSPAHTRTKAARPASPGHTARAPPPPADTPPGSDPDPSDRPRPTPSTPSDPPAATPPTTAASTTTAHADNPRNLEPSPKCLKPTRRHRFSDSLSPKRSQSGSRRRGGSDRPV